jgi:hypothetical protein
MAREVKVLITGDAKSVQKAFGQTADAADKLSDKLHRFGGGLESVGKKMTLGLTAPILALGAAATKNASDLAESQSKVQQVFGRSAAAIDSWAQGAAKNMGLSQRAALDAAGGFGNLLTQLGIDGRQAEKMSTSLVGLAADFASFHNADIGEVLDAQSAAFRGEYDSLQRFLPLINAATVEQKALELTGKKSTKELTAQDKALAVNALMFEGAGKAAGDFARTSDGAANKQRILRAEMDNLSASIGTKLLPLRMKLLGFAGDLIDKFNDLSPKSQDLAIKIAGIAAALGPLAIVGGKSVKGVAGLLDTFEKLGQKLPGINGKSGLGGACDELGCISGKAGEGSGALGGLGKSFGVLGAAIVGAAIGAKIESSFVRPTVAAVQSANDITATNTLAMQNRFIGAMAKMGASSAQIMPVNRVLNEMQRQGDLSSESMFRVYQKASLIGDAASAGLNTAGAIRAIARGGEDAEAAVASLQRKLDALHGKDVYIKVHATGNAVSGDMLSGLEYHRGGMVMHNGGQIPRYHWGAMAGDEVPAILQRGEFVMQRSAVSALGTGTMRAINSGAIPVAAGGTTVNVYVGGDVVTARNLIDAVHSGLLQKQQSGGTLGFK